MVTCYLVIRLSQRIAHVGFVYDANADVSDLFRRELR